MKLGCSLCGWYDLNIYRSEQAYFEFLQNTMKLSNLNCYELAFLPYMEYNAYYYKICSENVFSIHASKYIFEKDYKYIKEYFTRLREHCISLGCKYVVVHLLPTINTDKLELAINCMNGIYLSIENTEKNSFDIFNKYRFRCKMTIDIAHVLFLNQLDSFESLSKNDISHFHIRGFSVSQKYVSLNKNKSKKALEIVNNIIYNYNCPGILEYPYQGFLELQKDINLIKYMLKKVGDNNEF